MEKQYKIYNQDCVEALKELEDNSVDSIITDPPYGLGFMGKEWDSLPPSKEVFEECFRVLKHGGHLLSFGGTRTYHRMAVAIEDSGFEVRDMIEWVYGSGFPKSHNIGKAVDKLQGNEREVVGKGNYSIPKADNSIQASSYGISGGSLNNGNKAERVIPNIDKGASEWEGWGTALKPAHEPICMARKPFKSSVAENVLKWRTGGINIDESRVDYINQEEKEKAIRMQDNPSQDIRNNSYNKQEIKNREENVRGDYSKGRFPANLIHDNSEEVRECFPNESDRFFKSIIYQGKASKSERNKGCEALEEKKGGSMEANTTDKMQLGGASLKGEQKGIQPTKNNHPTVKPIALMEYLIKMVTPKGGIILDPFTGSGTTGVAALQNGYKFIGIEKESYYIPIIEARLQSVNKVSHL